MRKKIFKNQRMVWTAIVLSSALTQTSAWSDEAAPAPIEAAAPQEPQIDFRFPTPVLVSPGTAITDSTTAPAAVSPSYAPAPPAPEAEYFDSDKAREQEVTQERELERQRHLEERQAAFDNVMTGGAAVHAGSAGTAAPSVAEVPNTGAAPAPQAATEIRPTLILPPGFSRQQASTPARPSEGRIYSRGGFHEPECEDPSFKATLKKLVERDQKLILKQARHMEAIRRLRNEEGQHPAPELLAKLPPFDTALRSRISLGIPKATIAKRKPKLDRWIYNGQAEEKMVEMQNAGAQIKPRVKAQVESYGKFRQGLDKSQLADTSLKFLESYNAERVEVEHWIESFDRVCKSVAYLRKAQSRGMASVVSLR